MLKKSNMEITASVWVPSDTNQVLRSESEILPRGLQLPKRRQ